MIRVRFRVRVSVNVRLRLRDICRIRVRRLVSGPVRVESDRCVPTGGRVVRVIVI